MPEPLSRLVDDARSGPGDESAPAVVGQLLRKAEPPPLPTLGEFARIQEALDAATLRRTQRWPALWRVGLAVASLLVSVQAGRALMLSSWAAPLRQLASAILERPRPTPPSRPRRQPPPAPAIFVPEVAPPAPAEPPTPLIAALPSIPVAQRHAPRAAPPAPTPLALEAAELSRAQQLLGQDPAQSLELLANYRTHFPQGALSREADLTALSADLVLNRSTDALSILDRFARDDFASVQRAPELRVLRAELLAGSQHFDEAERAFAKALSNGLDGSLRERALYGVAACLEGLGKTSESRGAFNRYLEAYPIGRFADAARSALGDR